MAVFKDDFTNTWAAFVRYEDYTGKTRQKKKTGFKRQKDAKEWEREFLSNQNGQPNLFFGALCDKYLNDIEKRKKYSTYATKRNRIDKWIRPAFDNRRVSEITPGNIREWQNDLITAEGEHGKPLSPGYMHSLFTELSALFNYAVKYNNLAFNPCNKVDTIGHKAKSLLFWTREEFQQFIDTFELSDPFYAFFMVMYYTGMRRGECLALTVSDITDGRIIINKTYNVYDGQATITEPKTAGSVREITIPASLQDIIEAHINRIYGTEPDTRIFSMISRSAAAYQLNNHAELAGVKRIRVHDLRHSHASLLIDMGFSAILVSKRLGHDNVNTTLTVYAHLFPDRQNEVSDRLEELMKCSKTVAKSEQTAKNEEITDKKEIKNHNI